IKRHKPSAWWAGRVIRTPRPSNARIELFCILRQSFQYRLRPPRHQIFGERYAQFFSIGLRTTDLAMDDLAAIDPPNQGVQEKLTLDQLCMTGDRYLATAVKPPIESALGHDTEVGIGVI